MMKEWFLCVSCYVYALVRPRAAAVVTAPQEILIVQMAKLGDMVCTTPMFRAVKEKYPSCELTVVGNCINKELLANNTDVDQYIEFRGILQTIRELRKGKYDFACMTSPSAPLLAVLYLSGADLISTPIVDNGHASNDTLAYRLLTRLCVTRPHTMGQYAPREYLRLLEPLDIFSDDTTKHLAYSKHAAREAATFLESTPAGKDGLTIGISPSAGNKIKNWGGKKFAALAELLWKEYSANLVVIGGPRDKKEVKEMLNLVSSGIPSIDASEKFSIDGLKALIHKLDLFISVDTGPIYIAEAFGVPTVDIVGPMDEREQPPIGPKHMVVVPPGPRVPELHIMNAHGYDRKEAVRQTDSITVTAVFDACKNLIRIN